MRLEKNPRTYDALGMTVQEWIMIRFI